MLGSLPLALSPRLEAGAAAEGAAKPTLAYLHLIYFKVIY